MIASAGLVSGMMGRRLFFVRWGGRSIASTVNAASLKSPRRASLIVVAFAVWNLVLMTPHNATADGRSQYSRSCSSPNCTGHGGALAQASSTDTNSEFNLLNPNLVVPAGSNCEDTA
jgi:hypothetical protein